MPTACSGPLICLRLALLCCALFAAAPAADVVIDDLRLEVSPLLGRNWQMSGHLDDDTTGGPSVHTTDNSTQTVRAHRRTGIAYYHSLGPLEAQRGAFVVGLAGSYDRTQTQGGSFGRAWMLDGFGGFAWAFTPAWHIEEGIILGAGHDRWDIHFQKWYFDGSDWQDSDSAFIYEYGVCFGTTYTWQRHLQGAIDLRYLVSDARFTFTGTHTVGATTETISYRPRVRTEGLGGAFALGWRF